jgi:transcriptional regulator with XRE-family HTH domain
MAGSDMTNISRRAGLNGSFVRDIVEGKSKDPSAGNLKKLAAALNCTVDELYKDPRLFPGAGAIGQISENFIDNPPLPVATLYNKKIAELKTLNVLATQPAGKGFFIDMSRVLTKTDRPKNMAGVLDAFAVKVADDTLEPRFYRGEILTIDTFATPREKDAVLILDAANVAVARRLVSITDSAAVAAPFAAPDKHETYNLPGHRVYVIVRADRG